jgi:hypothetical protein
MNNQSKSFDDIKGFIINTKSYVCSSVFFLGVDF